MKSLAQTVSGGHLELAINQISRRGAGRSAMETWLAPVSHLRHSALRCASGDAYDGGCGAPPPKIPQVLGDLAIPIDTSAGRSLVLATPPS